MHPPEHLAQLPPAVIVHLFAALAALLLGPIALTARKGSRLHRAMGYAWVTLMLAAAASSVLIRDFRLPNMAGYTPIHILTLVTFIGVGSGVWFIAHKNIRRHRTAMISAYLGGCVTAGIFTLLPSRFLGQLVWHQWLGLI